MPNETRKCSESGRFVAAVVNVSPEHGDFCLRKLRTSAKPPRIPKLYLYRRLCPLSKRIWINSRQIIVPILPSSSEESPGWFPELRKPQADRYADCSSDVRKPCSSKNSILFLVPAPAF